MKTPQKIKRPFLVSLREIRILAGLMIVYLTTRLTNLRLWPIFTDEAIYTRWSQIALHDASLRFIPLTDGKQPLWHWFTIAAMKIISDPLIAGKSFFKTRTQPSRRVPSTSSRHSPYFTIGLRWSIPCSPCGESGRCILV